jgi:hypothetical protein
MSTQKTLSQLSVAAVDLLVVSLPCFAQTDNVAKTERDSDTTATVAINIERLASPFEAKSEDTQKPAPKFSAAQFMQAVQESPSVTIKTSSAFELVPAPTTRNNTWKGITFVPSRAPRYPWQVF